MRRCSPHRKILRMGAAVASGAVVASSFALGTPPQPGHVVVGIEENHGYDPILGASSPAAYIKSLAAMGASFTNSFAIDRPSQPNYLDLYSGDDQGTSGTNDYPANAPFTTPNLGAQF